MRHTTLERVFKEVNNLFGEFVNQLKQRSGVFVCTPLLKDPSSIHHHLSTDDMVRDVRFVGGLRAFFLRILARVQKAMPSSSSSTMVKPFSNLAHRGSTLLLQGVAAQMINLPGPSRGVQWRSLSSAGASIW